MTASRVSVHSLRLLRSSSTPAKLCISASTLQSSKTKRALRFFSVTPTKPLLNANLFDIISREIDIEHDNLPMPDELKTLYDEVLSKGFKYTFDPESSNGVGGQLSSRKNGMLVDVKFVGGASFDETDNGIDEADENAHDGPEDDAHGGMEFVVELSLSGKDKMVVSCSAVEGGQLVVEEIVFTSEKEEGSLIADYPGPNLDEVSERSVRAFWKTSILAMNPIK